MDDPVQNSLEEKFKAALSSVRPVHLSLLTYEEEQLSRLWILKLKSSEDGHLRVQLMRELARQIRGKKLSSPFNKYPPEGKSLKHVTYKDFGDTLDLYEEDSSALSTELLDVQSNLAENTTEDEEFDYNRDRNPKHKSIFTSFQNKEPINAKTVSFLKSQNDALLHEVCIYQKASKRNEKKMECVSREVEDLKLKLLDLQRINKTIEESHSEVINDYKAALIETTDELTSRLEILTRKNDEIGKALINLKKKYREPSPLGKKAYMELVAVTRKLSAELKMERAKRKAEVNDLQAILADKDHQIERLKRRLASLDEGQGQKRDQSPTSHCRMLMERVCELQTHIDKMSKASVIVQQKMKQDERKRTEGTSTRARSPKLERTTEPPAKDTDKKYKQIIHDIHDVQVEDQKRKTRGAEEKICPCRNMRK
ncbi:uncharacterized protein LOC106663398 isoform X2 [Cimex lectularius]|uniref:DUF4485 domain-containing protein n=1 Tax=Cimex lectularius TaxID=79782 RepID=A0A8I6RI50_CIMLE|nr:uncharacterized protein LOC106663398 isoform X2 [Cimex lectularius]